MKTLVMVTLSAALISLPIAARAAGASSYVQKPNSVKVNLSDVVDELARTLSLKGAKIPGSVKVPVGLAAQVCGVAATSLTSKNASCDAKTTSPGLEKAVKQKMIKS